MAFNDDRQAAAIAAEWGVGVDLLEETDWELETIDGNDGETYGYIVRFDEDTDPNILEQLGVRASEYTREVTVNAFDEPDSDREEFKLQEPVERQGGGRRAYYIDDARYTPSQFRRLAKRRKVEAMVQWFHENYEDPAVRTPYESREGGYQWIWGGPHDAHEEIGDQFSDVADEDTIEEAVSEVTSDGLFDWAPKERREDYDHGDELDYVPPPNSLMGLAAAAFTGSSFTGDAFATRDRNASSPQSERDDGTYSINEPFPDISDLERIDIQDSQTG